MRFAHETVRAGGTSAEVLMQTLMVSLPAPEAQRIAREG